MVLLLTAQQLGFFSKSEKKWVKRGVRVLRALHTRVRRRSPVSLSVFSLVPDLFFLTARAHLKMQKYGLFCNLVLLRSNAKKIYDFYSCCAVLTAMYSCKL